MLKKRITRIVLFCKIKGAVRSVLTMTLFRKVSARAKIIAVEDCVNVQGRTDSFYA
jgi:hypothetical protein